MGCRFRVRRTQPLATVIMHEQIVHRVFSSISLGPISQQSTLFFTVLIGLFGASLATCRPKASSNRYFVSHPPSELVYLRDRPIKVDCVVEFGVETDMICNNIPIPRTELQRKNVTRGQEISVTIGLNYIRRFGNRLSCRCIATKIGSDYYVSRSKCSEIIRPFLEKFFVNAPVSQEAAKGTTIRLRCTPPIGDPKPKVFWIYKTNPKGKLKAIQSYNGRYRIANGTDLLIMNVQVNDSGYYTCVATNSASYRYSNKAYLRVYDNSVGQWSRWSDWTTCSSGRQLRIRNCSKTPSNCRGRPSETRRCSTTSTSTTTTLMPTTTSGSMMISNQYSFLSSVICAILTLFIYMTQTSFLL